MDSIHIDYVEAKSLGVRADAEKAIQLFLSSGTGTSFTIFPQTLNPLLRALESVGLWKQVAVVPCLDSNGGKPLYTVVKLGANEATDISIQKMA